ncbi:hypothetical protein Lalb_Chr03g0043651 [Lupinus albus]|uniref:Uncharacterized protein n=1 Tax=Lupinus albus TaxID=3870 RepID=A0A6A4QXW5_LUPAL|nr:hypothetical protein Lalb_Chr03g0043651 [Lupinus albus]
MISKQSLPILCLLVMTFLISFSLVVANESIREDYGIASNCFIPCLPCPIPGFPKLPCPIPGFPGIPGAPTTPRNPPTTPASPKSPEKPAPTPSALNQEY